MKDNPKRIDQSIQAITRATTTMHIGSMKVYGKIYILMSHSKDFE
jgi:hypothetical protein